MRTRGLILVLLFAAACGKPGAAPVPQSPAPPGPRYEVSTTVLQDAKHGPELCLGAVATSLPPQCGGPPIVNWDWDKVAGEERVGGTIWGDYHVVGTFDGKAFTLTEPAGAPRPPAAAPPPEKSPCPKPSGGWNASDPSRASDADLQKLNETARREKDFAGLWLSDDPRPPNSEYQDVSKLVVNVAFTGDLERHERELRRIWGGALCVTKHRHTYAELEKIQNDVTSRLGADFGLDMLSVAAEENHDLVTAEVVLADADDQAAVDARYGPGVVKLTSALKPVSA